RLLQYVDHPVDFEVCLLGQDLGKRAASQVLHHQIGEAIAADGGESEVGYVDNVWMAEAPGSLGLASKTFNELIVGHELRGDYFEGNEPVCSQMGGEIDRTHAALSELLFDEVLVVENLAD